MTSFTFVGTIGTDRWGDVFRRVISNVKRVADTSRPVTIAIVVSGQTSLLDGHPSMRLLREEARQMGFRIVGSGQELEGEEDVLGYFEHTATDSEPAPRRRKKKE